MAGKHLKALAKDDANIEIEEIAILASPVSFMESGIRMIPALVIGEEILSSIYLNKQTIRDFISRHKEQNRTP